MKEGAQDGTEENELWEEGYFAETLGPQDIKEKMRTFHMKHDEEMNFNCKKCDKKNLITQQRLA
jgi:hypothetical protein|tara:strand:- start:280 stop:471 length:192 start_codon:yes stop_codon:yes gene_type:complete